MEYATSLFERETVERWLGYLRRVLEAMAADDGASVERLPMLAEGERTRVLRDTSETSWPADFARRAADALPPSPWDASTWKNWTEAVKADTGAKGKALFMPLRAALTGVTRGPELAPITALLGRCW